MTPDIIMTPPRRSTHPQNPLLQAYDTALHASQWLLASYLRLRPPYRLVALLLCATGLACVVVSLLYSRRLLAWLAPFAQAWRDLPAGWAIVFALVFVTAFPPLLGYSTANTVAGLVYGFPAGWPVAALACTAGSLCAFLACRTVLSARVQGLVGSDRRFVALAQVLRREGLLYLTCIRFCPLPFSASNGFLATVPSITPLAFTISTALSTPKLLIHVFIGSRLALLIQEGNEMSARDKAINYVGMALGAALGLAVGFVIYRRTMARAAELAREEEPAGDHAERGHSGYDDAETTLLESRHASAAVLSDDDLSLWDTQEDRDWEAYDDDNNDEDAGDSGKRKGKDGRHERSKSEGSNTT